MVFKDVGPMPAGGGEDYYTPPTRGNSQAQVWCNNSQVPVDHLVAGSFDSAARVKLMFLFFFYIIYIFFLLN